MDVSHEYIKQCEKAEEIQLGRRVGELEEGDFYSRDGLTGEIFCYEYMPDTGVWLPRQDQLQEMVEWEIPGSMTFKMEAFCYFAMHWAKRENEGGSFEQLWLAFVMKEYGKVWNGEEWVR